MRFAAEPAAPSRPGPATAIVLCNLGTPDAPTPAAVRAYLAEFLSDPRVVEIPRLLWWFILHGVILRTRPARAAAKYKTIWTPDGSPLAVWTDKQAKLLAGYLGERGHSVTVRHAMRYGKPSLAEVLDKLKAGGTQRILVLPAYPQYCSATTGSVIDGVSAWTARTRSVPELRFAGEFHLDEGYLGALARRVSEHWVVHGRPDKLVMSFHGMPERTRQLGDPYHDQCLATGARLARRLELRQDQWQLTFQSRLGRAAWLEPYTEPTLVAMAQRGLRRVDVICPGFVADNLETLEEINQEAREAFLAAGGSEFHHIPCLNDQHEWMVALTSIALQHLQGWDTRRPSLETPTSPHVRELQGP